MKCYRFHDQRERGEGEIMDIRTPHKMDFPVRMYRLEKIKEGKTRGKRNIFFSGCFLK